MPRAQSSQPTQFEGLSRIQPPKTAVNPQSQYSYNEARAGYVERPHGDYAALARMIRGFGDEANRALNQWVDNRIDEQVAKGREMYAENPELLKNRQNWKDYCEQNPDSVSRFWNPFLQKGYEEARLKNVAMNEKKAMEEEFLNSGLINETDQTKIEKWQQEFVQKFRKEYMLDKYEDKIMLANNFSPLEFANRQELLQKHTAAVVAQHETRLIEMRTELAMNEVDALMGGRRFMDGDVKAAAEIITQNTNIALQNGVMNSKSADIMTNMVFSLYEKYKQNPSVLKMLDVIKTANGATLSSLPGVQAKVNAAEKARIQFNWAQENQAHIRYERALKQEQQEAKTTFVIDSIKAGHIPSIEEMQKSGKSPNFIAAALPALVAVNKAQREGALASPDNQRALVMFDRLSKAGLANDDDIMAMAPIIGRDAAIELLDENRKAKDANSKTMGDMLKQVFRQASGAFSGLGKDFEDWGEDSREQDKNAVMFGNGSASQLQRMRFDMAQMVQAEMLTYMQNKLKKGEKLESWDIQMKGTEVLKRAYDTVMGQSSQYNQPFTPKQQQYPVSVANTILDPDDAWFAQNMPEINVKALGLTGARAKYEWLQKNRPQLTDSFVQAMDAATKQQ